MKKGWGADINFYIEPTFHYFDRTYHTVYQLNFNLYKTFLNNRLQIIASCTPINKRRILDRQSDNQTIRLEYTTPGLYGGIRIVWNFNGGKKDVKVNINPTSLDYQEINDNS